MCFILKENFLLAIFFLVASNEFQYHQNGTPSLFEHPSPHSRDEISQTNQDQVMLALILMVEGNDCMTISKHEATHRKGDKETGNEHVLTVVELSRRF